MFNFKLVRMYLKRGEESIPLPWLLTPEGATVGVGSIAQYDVDLHYAKNTWVFYNDTIYRSINTVYPSGFRKDSEWAKVPIIDSFIQEHSPNIHYKLDALVFYKNQLFRSNSTTQGKFNGKHWDIVYSSSEIDDVIGYEDKRLCEVTDLKPVATHSPQADLFTQHHPLPNIDTVVLLGASVASDISKFTVMLNAHLYLKYGLNVKFVDWCDAEKRTVSDAISFWESNKQTYKDNPNVLVAVHTLGDTVSKYGSFEILDEKAKTEVGNRYRELISSVTDNGNVPLIINTAFRDFGDTYYNEGTGVDTYNREVLIPTLKEVAPVLMYREKPYIDWYPLSKEISLTVQEANGIDFKEQGVIILGRFLSDCLANRILGKPPVIVDADRAKAYGEAKLRHTILVVSAKGESTMFSPMVPGATQYDPTKDIKELSITSLGGYGVNSVKWTSNAVDSTKHILNDVSNLTGASGPNIENKLVKRGGVLYRGSKTYHHIGKLSGLPIDTPLRLSICSKVTIGPIAEVTSIFSIDGVTPLLEIDSRSNNNIATVQVKANSKGELDLYFKGKGGFCYFNGLFIEELK